MAAERTETHRCFDLRPTGFMAPLHDRLVVQWLNPRSWHRNTSSASAARMPVFEIVDRDKVPFPGVRRSAAHLSVLTFAELLVLYSGASENTEFEPRDDARTVEVLRSVFNRAEIPSWVSGAVGILFVSLVRRRSNCPEASG